jgi:predicted metal-binding membrane protein
VAPTLLALGALAVLAWAAAAAHAHPATGARFLPAFAMWNVMMVAMMLPAALPWFAILARPGTGSATTRSLLFGAGYFSMWTLYAAGAAWLQTTLDARGLLGVGHALPEQLAGLVLAGAGLFQFTGLKQACLRHCRSPLGTLMAHWREGASWALRAGLSHGAYCVGCCWALMIVAFAAGLTDPGAMALVTAAILAEQWLPGGRHASHAVGAALIFWGILVLAG